VLGVGSIAIVRDTGSFTSARVTVVIDAATTVE
jgi:hypothetical protein